MSLPNVRASEGTKRMRGNRSFLHKSTLLPLPLILATTALATLVTSAGCSAGDGLAVGALQAAAEAPEDALAEAYGVFKQTFVNDGENRRFHLGYGFHPGLATTKV